MIDRLIVAVIVLFVVVAICFLQYGYGALGQRTSDCERAGGTMAGSLTCVKDDKVIIQW